MFYVGLVEQWYAKHNLNLEIICTATVLLLVYKTTCPLLIFILDILTLEQEYIFINLYFGQFIKNEMWLKMPSSYIYNICATCVMIITRNTIRNMFVQNHTFFATDLRHILHIATLVSSFPFWSCRNKK